MDFSQYNLITPEILSQDEKQKFRRDLESMLLKPSTNKINKLLDLKINSKISKIYQEDNRKISKITRNLEKGDLEIIKPNLTLEEKEAFISYLDRTFNKNEILHEEYNKKRTKLKRKLKTRDIEIIKPNLSLEEKEIFISDLERTFNKNELPLEESKNELKQQMMELRECRNDSLWVQCSNKMCNKWRFVEAYKDPLEVPEDWFCNMITGTTLEEACAVPVECPGVSKSFDFIYAKYTAGSLVWANSEKSTWNAAMVDDSFRTKSFYKLNQFSDIPISYFVVFLHNPPYGKWVIDRKLQPFTRNKFSEKFEMIHTKEFHEGYEKALELLPLTPYERLVKYGLLTRCQHDILKYQKKF